MLWGDGNQFSQTLSYSLTRDEVIKKWNGILRDKDKIPYKNACFLPMKQNMNES